MSGKQGNNMIFIVLMSLLMVSRGEPLDKCPEVEPIKNFDFNAYTNGLWFEVGRYNHLDAENKADCVVCNYTGAADNPVHSARCHEIYNKKPKILDWTVTRAPGAGNDSRLLYSFHRNAGENVTLTIVHTDYKTYAVIYTCMNDKRTNKPIELAWVKSRTPSMNPETKAQVLKLVQEHPSIDESKMVYDHFTHEACLMDVPS